MTQRRDATLLVAFAAALWGLDGLLRKPLAKDLDAGTVVLWEHVIALLALAPTVPAALRAFRRCRFREQAAIVVIGVGSSAVATALFTRAFALTHDYVTPLVLQKLQPIAAVLLALVILGERLRPAYAYYATPALAGAWLLTFAKPFDIQVTELEVAALALGAAVLWAAGTVLGRLVSFSLSPQETTTLRYVFGLVGAVIVVQLTSAAWTPGWHNALGLILLALIPGLIALRVYYFGLRSTAASRATLAELAFPATAAVVGVLFLNSKLTWSQWIGFAVIVVAVVGLSWHEQRRRPAVEAPQPALAAIER